MTEKHDHDYSPVEAFDGEGVKVAAWSACRVCGADDPSDPKPEIPEVEE